MTLYEQVDKSNRLATVAIMATVQKEGERFVEIKIEDDVSGETRMVSDIDYFGDENYILLQHTCQASAKACSN